MCWSLSNLFNDIRKRSKLFIIFILLVFLTFQHVINNIKCRYRNSSLGCCVVEGLSRASLWLTIDDRWSIALLCMFCDTIWPRVTLKSFYKTRKAFLVSVLPTWLLSSETSSNGQQTAPTTRQVIQVNLNILEAIINRPCNFAHSLFFSYFIWTSLDCFQALSSENAIQTYHKPS